MLSWDLRQTHDGRPLQVLQELIVKRMQVLNEWRRDAVVATAITVLQSVRSATRQHKGRGVKVTHA